MNTLNKVIASLIAGFIGNTAKVVQITIEELETILKDWKGNKTVSLIQLTSQARDLTAASARENELLKLTEMTVFAGTDGETRVNNQLLREGKEANYEAMPSYMEKINNVLGRNKKNPKQKYFITYPFDNSYPKSQLFLNGDIVQKSDILSLYKPSSLKEYESKVQGTDKKIPHMRPKLESLIALKFDHVVYVIK